MSRLTDTSYRAVKKTGIFQSAPPYYSHHLNPNLHVRQMEKTSTQGKQEFGSHKSVLLTLLLSYYEFQLVFQVHSNFELHIQLGFIEN